ncbi:EndoU domain-containing protein [Chryseobacterium carnipullorum]|uniref:EndoU domain-containing protein n=1 Tax=Chryseobacterium carnipullorum TaxID=1124835 RepID=UPI0009F89BB0
MKTVFPDNLSEGQVENLVRSAYKNSKKVKKQGDRVLLRGNDIEMWVNTKTKTIETAYPIIRE